MTKPILLAGTPFAAELLEPLDSISEIARWKERDNAREFLVQRGSAVRAVVTNGMAGLPAGSAQHLERVQLIVCNGVGSDAIDMDWAQRHGLAVANAPNVLFVRRCRPCARTSAARVSTDPTLGSAPVLRIADRCRDMERCADRGQTKRWDRKACRVGGSPERIGTERLPHQCSAGIGGHRQCEGVRARPAP